MCNFCGLSERAETIVTDLSDTSAEEIPPPIHLPSLPALTTLVIELWMDDISPRLTNILCSIDSAPVLTSIAIESSNWNFIEHPHLAGPWVDVDRWLSRIARHAKVKGELPLMLRLWPKGRSVWPGFLPEFRESGGEIKLNYSNDF